MTNPRTAREVAGRFLEALDREVHDNNRYGWLPKGMARKTALAVIAEANRADQAERERDAAREALANIRLHISDSMYWTCDNDREEGWNDALSSVLAALPLPERRADR